MDSDPAGQKGSSQKTDNKVQKVFKKAMQMQM
jgi:hypothetical protein